jgi:hypothetical protein
MLLLHIFVIMMIIQFMVLGGHTGHKTLQFLCWFEPGVLTHRGVGVQSCAVDPGSVATSIYKDSPLFSRPPASWVISGLYSPPRDGARIIVDAARAPWPSGTNPRRNPGDNEAGQEGGLAALSRREREDGVGDLRVRPFCPGFAWQMLIMKTVLVLILVGGLEDKLIYCRDSSDT